jgi:ribosomal protein S18 acetylase RimI-like enzyme
MADSAPGAAVAIMQCESMSVPIEYRPATRDDSRQVARFICAAGGGLYEFLFDDLIPFMSAADLLAGGVVGDSYPISHRNCFVAAAGHGGDLVGAANAFPADALRDDAHHQLGAERHAYVRAMLELQDWGSMFLNALAVSGECRGRGVGTKLLAWAEAQAKAGGFDRLSLHVWADNAPARAFYQDRGFVALGTAEVARHPRLDHLGGSILMCKTLR